MRIANAVLVLTTLLAYVGAYFQEKRRLATMLGVQEHSR